MEKIKKNKILIIISVSLIVISIILLIFKYKTDNSPKQDSSIFGDAIKIDEGIFDYQKRMDANIQKIAQNKSYTLDNAQIITNPYKLSPLSALIIFYTSDKVSIEIKINDENIISFDETNNHIIPIYGLYPGKDNKISIKSSDGKEKIYSIKTEPIDEEMPIMTISKAMDSNQNIYFMNSESRLIGFDSEGTIRWYLDANNISNLTVLDNGHLLVTNSIDNLRNNNGQTLIEIDLLGKIYNEYRTPAGFHGQTAIINDNYLIAANNPNSNRNFDYIIEMNKKGEIVKTFDLYEIVKKIDSNFANNLNDNWAENRTIAFDGKTNSIIVALRNRNSIISINYTSSTINWIFGDIKNWSNNFSQYMLNKDNNIFYPNGIANLNLDVNGNLLIYNNNFDTSLYNKEISCNSININSLVGIYNISNKTVKTLWEYNHNNSLFSYDYGYLKEFNNHKLILSNTLENSSECTLMDNLINSKLIEIDENNNIILEANINTTFITVEVIDFYTPDSKEVKTTAVNRYNTYQQLIGEKINLSEVEDNLNNAEKFAFAYEITSNKLKTNAIYAADFEVKLLLISESNTSYEYLIKEKNKPLRNEIPLDDLKGKYHIYLIINNEYKDSETIIEY